MINFAKEADMKLLYTFFSICTALIGYTIHGSIFWSVMDFFFVPFVWIKWFIYHEVTISIIRQTFNWFFA